MKSMTLEKLGRKNEAENTLLKLKKLDGSYIGSAKIIEELAEADTASQISKEGAKTLNKKTHKNLKT